MCRPTTLLVDYGGVLTTSLWDSIRACARREHLPDDAILDLITTDPHSHALFTQLERGRISQQMFEHHLATRLGISPDQLLTRMCADLQPDHQILAAIGTLRHAGIGVAVVSNSWGTGDFDPYQLVSLDRYADLILLSDQFGIRKPEPGIYQLAVDKLGVNPHDCVFIDDIPANLTPAHAMNMHTIHHTDPATTIIQLHDLFGVPLARAE